MLLDKYSLRKLLKTVFPLCLAVLLFFMVSLTAQNASRPIQNIYFKGDYRLSQGELLQLLGIKKNQLLSYAILQEKIKIFQHALHDEGFLYAKVDSFRTALAPDSNYMDISVFGSSGPRFYIGRISLKADSLPAGLYRRQLSLHAGEIYRPRKLQKDIRQMLVFAADSGYPFAKINVDTLAVRREGKRLLTDIALSVNENKKVFIKDIIVKGNKYTKSYVLLRELDIAAGMVYSESAITGIPSRLNRLNIFKKIDQPEVIKASADSVFILIPVTEGNAASFDGVVGYIPEAQQNSAAKSRGYFTGLINIVYKNLFGTGRKFMVHWQKPDRLSEEFRFSYLEPWVMGYPLNLGTGLQRIVRDTTYIQWDIHLLGEVRLTHNLSLILSVKKRSVIPDSAASRDFRLPQSSAVNGEAGIIYDTRDSRNNPRSGIYYKSSYIFGLKTNNGPAYLLKEDSLARTDNLHSLVLDAEGYLNFWQNQVLSLSAHLRQIKGRRLTLSDYFYFGGSRSIRGYRENQFSGNLATWLNLEYRFLTGRNSRLFLFTDAAYYQNKLNGVSEEWLYGYGIGLRMDTPLGILAVDYGLGKGDSFSMGKIHFGVISTF